jgi:hypothetical protein
VGESGRVSTGVLQLILSQIDTDSECSSGWFSCVPPPQPFLCWQMLFHRWTALVVSLLLSRDRLNYSIASHKCHCFLLGDLCTLEERFASVKEHLESKFFPLGIYWQCGRWRFVHILPTEHFLQGFACFLMPFLIFYQCAL